jgi:hypothetical protein
METSLRLRIMTAVPETQASPKNDLKFLLQ